MDDERLLAAVAGGDSTALRELFARHAPWLAARLRRTLPVDAVEDVLQEAFIAVWKGAARYSGEGAVGASRDGRPRCGRGPTGGPTWPWRPTSWPWPARTRIPL